MDMFVFYRGRINGDSFVDYFENREDAVEAAEVEWEHICDYDRRHTDFFYVGENDRSIPEDDEWDEYANEVNSMVLEYLNVDGRFVKKATSDNAHEITFEDGDWRVVVHKGDLGGGMLSASGAAYLYRESIGIDHRLTCYIGDAYTAEQNAVDWLLDEDLRNTYDECTGLPA